MQSLVRNSALLLGCAVLLTGVAGAEEVIPSRLANARLVAFGIDVGGGRFISELEAVEDYERIPPKDRQRLAELRTRFEEWGRFGVTARPEQADLLVVIRPAKGLADAGVTVGSPQDGASRARGSYTAELDIGADMLSVFASNTGRAGTLLWRRRRDGGLSGSPPPLFEEFEQYVEAAARQTPSGPRVSLAVRAADGATGVRVGEKAVATIGFHGGGWGSELLRWDLYFDGRRVSCASVPVAGDTASGRQIDVEWMVTKADCARLASDKADPMASVTVQVRRASDEPTLESAPARVHVDCGR